MAFNVEEIRSQLVAGGARPTLFQVIITNPVNSIADLKVPFMVRAAALPESELGLTPVSYFGRVVKFAGDRTFRPWQVTVINDEDFLVRNAMEQWSNAINSHQGNLRNFTDASPLLYKSTAEVTQFAKTGEPIRTYRFNGIYPAQISNIGLDWSAQNRIEEFTVTFEYDYWEISDGITGDAGGI